MKIGIDISQIAYENTGVAVYLKNFVESLVAADGENEYILFFSSMRKTIQNSKFKIQNSNANVKIKNFKLPPSILDLLWNKWHTAPIEWFIGDIDVFISSDWTQPPVKKAVSATILYDLIVYKYPAGMDKKIVSTQRRRMRWVKKEADIIFCISEATKKDAIEIFNIDKTKLKVAYPGL